MELVMLLIFIGIPVGALLWFSLWVGDKSYDGAMKRAHERRQEELNDVWAQLVLTPRWSDDQLTIFHPDAMIVLNLAQRLGDDWHVLLTAFDPDTILDNLPENTFLLACTGQQVEPIGLVSLKPAFDALEHTITCPNCHQAMTRIYAFNNQPPYAYNIHPQEHQLMLTPELVRWDTTSLRPDDTQSLRKESLKKQARW